jgi:hypothetical protein
MSDPGATRSRRHQARNDRVGPPQDATPETESKYPRLTSLVFGIEDISEPEYTMLMQDAASNVMAMFEYNMVAQVPQAARDFKREGRLPRDQYGLANIAAALAALSGRDKKACCIRFGSEGIKCDRKQVNMWMERLTDLSSRLEKGDQPLRVAHTRAELEREPSAGPKKKMGRPVDPGSKRQRFLAEADAVGKRLSESQLKMCYHDDLRKRAAADGPGSVASEQLQCRVRDLKPRFQSGPLDFDRHAEVALGKLAPNSVSVKPNSARPKQPEAKIDTWAADGYCNGTTRLGTRCMVHRNSKHKVAQPLREGEKHCGHHHPNKYTGVRCAAIRKNKSCQCNVWSGSMYDDAAPLRRGSPYCHHHRVQCSSNTAVWGRCKLTSSSEHADAEPLRQGAGRCSRHPADAMNHEIAEFLRAANESDCEDVDCDKCGQLKSCCDCRPNECEVCFQLKPDCVCNLTAAERPEQQWWQPDERNSDKEEMAAAVQEYGFGGYGGYDDYGDSEGELDFSTHRAPDDYD